jgi:hypothetical protein
MLNYVGGAIIFIKAFYADRIRLLAESWALCSGKNQAGAEAEAAAGMEAEEDTESQKKKGDKKGGKGDSEEHDD